MPTITYTGRLVVTSCWCGINLAIPDDLHSYAMRQGTSVCCPLGHKFIYNDSIKQRLEEAEAKLQRANKRIKATTELLRHEEASHRTTRGHVTRKRKQLERVKAGVCPCCKRSFKDLALHMNSKHPNYTP